MCHLVYMMYPGNVTYKFVLTFKIQNKQKKCVIIINCLTPRYIRLSIIHPLKDTLQSQNKKQNKKETNPVLQKAGSH